MSEENRIYTCTHCDHQGPSEDFVFFFPKENICLCNECVERAMRENVKQAVENGEPIRYVGQNGEVLNPADAIRAQVLHGKQMQDSLAHMRQVIATNTPARLKAHLDELIIGQEDAKKVLSVAVYNHYKRILYDEMVKQNRQMGKTINPALPSTMKKSNIIMVGPSGTGKTALLKAMAEFLDVPFAITDASSLTESGFVGLDPDTCIKNLYNAAGQDVKKAEHGIIFLDEFDKLARKSGTSRSLTADPGREGVQQALLKIIEGTVVNFNPSAARRNPDAPSIYMDTSNILFVCGGAFEGIDDIIARRIDASNGFGFGRGDELGLEDVDDEAERYNMLIDHITNDDIKEYGIIPEMLGRLPITCKLHQLKEQDLVHILTEPKDAILKQFRMLFNFDHCSLHFDDAALKAIAKKAIRTKTGARSLRTIVENMFIDIMYELPEIAGRAGKDQRTVIHVSEENVEDRKFKIEYQQKTAA